MIGLILNLHMIKLKRKFYKKLNTINIKYVLINLWNQNSKLYV